MKTSRKKTAKKAPTSKKKSLFGKTSSKRKSKPVNGVRMSKKKLLAELVSIEKEGRLYDTILRDARLKKQPEIVKATRECKRLLGKRQAEIFKKLGI